jgi:hypothetical protein
LQADHSLHVIAFFVAKLLLVPFLIYLWIVFKASSKVAARHLQRSKVVQKVVNEARSIASEVRDEVETEIRVRNGEGETEKPENTEIVKNQLLSTDEAAYSLNQIPGELMRRGGFSFTEVTYDKTGLRCDWEVSHFINAIMLLMVYHCPELHPHTKVIGSKCEERYEDALGNLLPESLLTLGIIDKEAPVEQFRLRLAAYKTAWSQANGRQNLYIASVLSFLLYEVKEVGNFEAADRILARYLNQPEIISGPWFQSKCIEHHLFASELSVYAITNIRTFLTSFSDQYQITQ